MANRKYTHVSHQYSLDFADAEVIPSEDDGLIERFKFEFKPIDQVSSIDNGSFVDIIGICQKVSEVANFTSKKGTDLTKRTFWIVDHSASNIILSKGDNTKPLWRDGRVKPSTPPPSPPMGTGTEHSHVEFGVMHKYWGVSDVLHEFLHNLSYTSEL